MSKKLAGRFLAAIALVGGALLAVPMLANAEDAAPACASWYANPSQLTATAAGTVTVSGTAGTLSANIPCQRHVSLIAYKTPPTAASWRPTDEVNRASVGSTWRKGDKFSQSLTVPVGTALVCTALAPDDAYDGCWQVSVEAGADGQPTTPVVVAPAARPTAPATDDDGPIDICGNCV